MRYKNKRSQSLLFKEGGASYNAHPREIEKFSEEKLIKAISESFKRYKEFGARSTEKLKPLHLYIANVTQFIWGNDFQTHFMSEETKEITVEGKYYPKDIDISVTQNDSPVFCLGIKFVTSNYKQNANNYFENMMGETANIQARKDLPYAQLIILRRETPYYKKEGELEKIEIIDEGDLQKYINLVFDLPQAHRPFAIGIVLVDINEDTNEVKIIDPSDILEPTIAELIQTKLSVVNLFNEIENHKKFYTIQK
jgi:hypothetical protein